MYMMITLNALLGKQRVFRMTWAGAIVPGPPGCECGFVTRVTALWRGKKDTFHVVPAVTVFIFILLVWFGVSIHCAAEFSPLLYICFWNICCS